MRKARENERSGTQSIERAIALLRAISTRGHFGWQLSDLAARCQLGKSTAHRMLVCLVQERLVKQRPEDRHYMPGPMLFELGLALPDLGELQYKARTILASLAKQTSATAFLDFRSGDHFVCAVRVGNSELKALTCSPGTRRPLTASVGGAAILLKLPEDEAHAIIRRNLAGHSKASAAAVRRMMARTYAEGIGINEGDILPGVNAFGIALCDGAGQPFASIALAAPDRVLRIERLTEIRRSLENAAEELMATSN